MPVKDGKCDDDVCMGEGLRNKIFITWKRRRRDLSPLSLL